MKTIIKKRLYRALIILFALISSLSASAQSKLFLDGVRYYTAGELDEASSIFRQIVESEPSNDAAWYYLAMTSTDGRQIRDCLGKAIELDPDNYWYRYFLATFYSQTDNLELAEETFNEITRLFPKRTDVYYDLINLHLRRNDAEAALSLLDKIEGKRGKREITSLTRYELLNNLSRNEEGIERLKVDYKEVRSPQIACILAEAAARSYDETSAINYFSEALEMNPDDPRALFGKSMVHYSLRQFDEYFNCIGRIVSNPEVRTDIKASQLDDLDNSGQFASVFAPQIDTLYANFVQSAPQDSTALLSYAGHLYRTGRVDDAVAFLRYAIGLYPESFQAHITYCLVLYYGEDWKEAILAASDALQIFPESRDLLQIRGMSYIQDGQDENAVADYNRFLSLAPRDSATALTAYTALGDLAYKMNDRKTAYANFEKALKVNPGYNPVLNNYAYYISQEILESGKPVKQNKNKRLNKALAMSRITIETEPDNPTYLDTYAWLLHINGQNLEAKAHFKHAMLYGGRESKEILNHYATVLDALGEKDLADVYRRQAKALAN